MTEIKSGNDSGQCKMKIKEIIISNTTYNYSSKMVVKKFFLFLLLLQDKSIVAVSNTTVSTTEGSTLQFSFKVINEKTECIFSRDSHIFKNIDRNNTSKYNIEVSKQILEFRISNVTESDKGVYRMVFSRFDRDPTLELKTTDSSCTSLANRQVCPIEGSSTLLTFMFETHVHHVGNKVDIFRRGNIRKISNFDIKLTIHNVTSDDEGIYQCFPHFDHASIMLEVASNRMLWFINQTDRRTIVGQEGIELIITCYSDTDVLNITALKLVLNGTTIAIGDKHYVSYSFIPDRTDHMAKYKCIDITQPSIMTEVELIIRYAPTLSINYTNGTIECKCDGVPAIYMIYRLDQTSQYGPLVRSVNLNNEPFALSKEAFLYQRNGRYVCFVSNGIPDVNGTVLQTTSINVKYEGPPEFTKENRNVNIGEVGKSITLQFYVYSYPKVGYIYIEKLGLNQTRNRTIDNYNILAATLLYTEYDNKVGIQGYEILIEFKILDIDDFQKYRITAKNRLGASDYHFEIIDNENLPWSKKKMTYVVILCSLASVIFVYTTIVQVCICVRHDKTRARAHINVSENQQYHTYDDIGSVNESQSFNTIENQNRRHTRLRESSISIVDNLQLAIASSEMNSTLSDSMLPQREVTEVKSLLNCVAANETNTSNMDVSGISSADLPSIEKVVCNYIQTDSNTDNDSLIDLNSQLCNNSGSELSNTVMTGSVGDGYEDP